TFAFIPGAVIVDIAPFLDFCDESTAAMSTRDQPLKCPGVFLLTSTTPSLLSQYLLHMVKEVRRNERFIDASIMLSSPDEVSIIERIGEHAMNTASRHFHPVARTQTLVPSLCG